MVRILIEWKVKSPFLQVLTGILTAEDIDCSYSTPAKLLFKCRVKIEQGSTGYSSLNKEKGMPSEIFDKLKPVMDVMVHSYYRGAMLKSDDFYWVIEEPPEITPSEIEETCKVHRSNIAHLPSFYAE